MNIVIKKSVLVPVFILIAIAAYCHTEIAPTSYPSLGQIQAEFDKRLGRQKYYLHGYIESEASRLITKKLQQKNIEPVFRGCEVGGPGYQYEMTYNRAVRQYLPDDYLNLSGDDFEFMPRINEKPI